MANAVSTPGKLVITFPPVPNVGSSAPLAVYRASANFGLFPLFAHPTATTRPSGWASTSSTMSAVPVANGVVVRPPSPNDATGLPGAGPLTAST